MKNDSANRPDAASLAGPVAYGPLVWGVWYLLVFSLPFTDILFFPDQLRNAGQPSTFLIALLWAALFAEWMLRRRPLAARDAVNRPLLAFFGVAAVSSLMSYYLPSAEFLGNVAWDKSLRQLLHFGLFVSVFLFATLLIRSERRFEKTLRVFLAAVALVLSFGLVELSAAYFNLNLFQPVLDAFHWGSWYEVPGQDLVIRMDTPFGELPRLRLVFAEPSMAAPFLALCFILLAGEALRRRRFRWLWGGLAIFSVVCLVLTLSIGGYLMLLLVASLFVLLLPARRFRSQYAAALCGVALLLLVVPALREFSLAVQDRVTGADLSSRVRIESVEAGMRMTRAYPVLGVGFGNSPFYIYDFLPWRPEVRDYLGWYISHGEFVLPVLNLFVRMFAETGIVGGLLFVWWHGRILRSGWQARSAAQDAERRLVSTMLFICGVTAVLGYFAESGFDKRYWPFALGLCLAWARIEKARRADAEQEASPASAPLPALAGAHAGAGSAGVP